MIIAGLALGWVRVIIYSLLNVSNCFVKIKTEKKGSDFFLVTKMMRGRVRMKGENKRVKKAEKISPAKFASNPRVFMANEVPLKEKNISTNYELKNIVNTNLAPLVIRDNNRTTAQQASPARIVDIR